MHRTHPGIATPSILKGLLKSSFILLCLSVPSRAAVPTETTSPATVVSADEVKPASPDNAFITLTRTPIDEEKLPTNATVIRQQDIDRQGFQNAGQVVDYAASVYVQKTSQLGSVFAPKIRGFLNKQIAVFVDNRRIPRDVTGSVDLSQIPVEAIDRIEIVRGASSVLYGPDAEGGIIHIITKKAKGYLPTLSGSAIGGSDNTQLYRAQFGTKQGRAEGYATMSRNHSDNYQDNSAFDNVSFFANGGYDFGTWGKTQLYFSHSRSELGLPGGTTVPISEWNGDIERRAKTPFTKQTDQNESIELEHVVDVMDKVTLTGRLTATDLLRDQLDTSTGPVTDFGSGPERSRVDQRTVYVQADTFFGFTAGFEYINEQMRSIFSAVPQTNEYGILFQQVLNLGSLTVIPGVRYDNNTEWGNTTNPRLSVVYQAAPWLKLSGNAGSAFQAPTFADLTDYSNFDATPITRLSTAPTLSPEKSWQYDVGAEVRPMDGLDAKVTVFRADIRDRLAFVDDPAGNRSTTINIQKAFNQGVEVEVTHTVAKWFTQEFNYSYLQSEGKGDNFSPDFIELSFVPRNRFNYLSWFYLPGNVDLGSTLHYVGEQYTSKNRTGIKLPDYLTWDLEISYRWKAARLQMGVRNVLERRYAENGGFGVIYPQPGRTFWGGVSVQFL